MNIVVFSGSGMSAESGIDTFRTNGGLWEHHKIEDVATPDAWKRNPELVQSFYNMRRKHILEVEPNKAHQLIAALEKRHQVTVITQNIDDLHERAGSKNVVHLHGNIRFSKSSGPNQEEAYYPIEGWELTMNDLCPEGFPLRPHVVWFGENVPMINVAIDFIQKADVLIVVGTSLTVYPAAGLIHYAGKNCKKYIIDPNVGKMYLPKDFISFATYASDGIQACIEEIERR
jgi:NAD-dependent deacetylase